MIATRPLLQGSTAGLLTAAASPTARLGRRCLLNEGQGSAVSPSPRRALTSSVHRTAPQVSSPSAPSTRGPVAEQLEDDEAYSARIEANLFSLPIVQKLIALSTTDASASSSSSRPPIFKMHRPYGGVPPTSLQHHMTAGLMRKRTGFATLPLCFSPVGDSDGSDSSSGFSAAPVSQTSSSLNPRRTYTIYQLGPSLCGHPSIIHGGLISTLFDEALAIPGFAAFTGTRVGLTASLEVRYKQFVEPHRFVVIEAGLEEGSEGKGGRKAMVSGEMRYADEGYGKVLAEGKALFVEPRDEKLVAMLRSSPNATP